MSDFKEHLAKDIGVFINFDEFGSLHNVNGSDIVIVVDEDLFQERGSTQKEANFGGVFIKTKSLFIRPEDLEKPLIDERMLLDGVYYLVEDVIETEFIYEVQISRRDY